MNKKILAGAIILSLILFNSAKTGKASVFNRIKVTRLDYSCWRTQSDSDYPVFINKKKPVIDLPAKINRCFVNRTGFTNPEFAITYDFFGGNNTKYKTKIDRETWIKTNKGCYIWNRNEKFIKISC